MNGFALEMHRDLDSDLAAVLLAGGRSLRMGCDKALLRLHGRPILQALATRLRALTDRVCLSANDPFAYAFLGLPMIPDIYPGCGPLAGLHAAMTHSTRPLLLVLACDLPGVETGFLRRMVDCSRGFDAVIPATSDGLLHPACAVYRRTCLDAVERNLSTGQYQMLKLLEVPGLHIRRLDALDGAFADANLIDLNCPEDYEAYLKLSRK